MIRSIWHFFKTAFRVLFLIICGIGIFIITVIKSLYEASTDFQFETKKQFVYPLEKYHQLYCKCCLDTLISGEAMVKYLYPERSINSFLDALNAKMDISILNSEITKLENCTEHRATVYDDYTDWWYLGYQIEGIYEHSQPFITLAESLFIPVQKLISENETKKKIKKETFNQLSQSIESILSQTQQSLPISYNSQDDIIIWQPALVNYYVTIKSSLFGYTLKIHRNIWNNK